MFIGLEAVHLSANLFDTNDIQTIRGGSLLMEEMAGALEAHIKNEIPGGAEIEPFAFGGSRVVLECPGYDANALEKAAEMFLEQEPQCYLSLRYRVSKSRGEALRATEGQLYQGWTIRPTPAWSADVQDPLDNYRPADVEDWAPDSHTDGEVRKRLLSRRSVAFRKSGKRKHPLLELERPKSLHDLVAAPPADISLNAKNKIAFVYADGSGFGALRKRLVEGSNVSQFLLDMRTSLGADLKAWIEDNSETALFKDVDSEGNETLRARLDVLMWGGDDMAFVMPSWLLFPFLQTFFGNVDNWDKDERVTQPNDGSSYAITHRVCAIIANVKTPIRILYGLASGGQKLLKSAAGGRGPNQSYFSVDVFESIAPPFDTLASYRRSIYGAQYSGVSDAFSAEEATSFTEVVWDLLEDKADQRAPLSITQIHRQLDALKGEGMDICSDSSAGALGSADAAINKALSDYGARTGASDASSKLAKLPRGTAMSLAQIAQLEPYLRHLSGRRGGPNGEG